MFHSITPKISKYLFLSYFFVNTLSIYAQQPNQFPDATWLQDVHWSGTIYAGVPGPLMPSVQAHLDGLEHMFHLKSDVETAKPLIQSLHGQGKKYWVNLAGDVLEGNINAILNDEQGIYDPKFGASISLEGNYIPFFQDYLRSINRPAWRNFLISSIKRAVEAGASGSQHDGAAVAYESFSQEEVDAFKDYVEDNGITTGGWNPNQTDFNDFLINKGKNDSNVFENDSDPQNVKDLINHWKEFKAVASLKSWKTIRDSCRIYAQSLGQEYTIALNAGSAIGTKFGHTYLASDFGIGEFFQWGHLFPFTGTLAVKSRAFEAFGKRFILWSSPTLADIPKNPYDPYEPEIEKESSMQTIATLYASGGLPQLKYPAYDTYPAYLLAQINRDVLNSVSSAGEIGVVMSHAQTLHDSRGFYGLTSVLQDLSRSFKVIWFKPNKLNIADDLTQNDLTKFKVIFLPEVFYLTDNQRSQLLTYISNGGTVLAVRGNVEYSGWVDENGDAQANATWSSLADNNTSGVKTYGSGRFINVAHNILESNGYPPPLYGFAYTHNKAASDPGEANLAISIRDTIASWLDVALPQKDVVANSITSNLKVFRYQDTLSNHYVYHFLSDSVEIPSRRAISINSFDVELAVAPISYGKTFKATFHTIDNPNGIPITDAVNVNQATGRLTVTLPQFSRWGFINLTETQQKGSVNVSNLLVNNSATPYRLKSGSDINVSWDVQNGNSNKYQVEVWTNLRGDGNPIISKNSTQPNLSPLLKESVLKTANKIYSQLFNSKNSAYIIPGHELRDSTVYFVRLRAVEQGDTSKWIQQFFYRNGRPAHPTEPKLFTSHQNLWYSSGEEGHLAPPDTSSKMIFSFKKGVDNKGRYGGDYELDTLLYGIKIYTDSLEAKKGNANSEMHFIGSQFRRKLGPFEGGDDIIDTLLFSLEQYENYGIYFQPFATDFIDTSYGGTIFGFHLDNHNDPPNKFNLISPENHSYTQTQIPFSWERNGDPDPFSKINYSISSVELLFDSVATFDSPGLKTYTKDRTGLDFEKDTITVELPSNFFQFEGLFNYKTIYWKVKMQDFDRDVAEGGGKGILSRESSDIFKLNVGLTPNAPEEPILLSPVNNIVVSVDTLNFKWRKTYTGADIYWFEYSSDSLFSNSVIDSTLIDSFKTVALESEVETFWWRVKGKNVSGWSLFSSTFKFSKLLTGIEFEEEIPKFYSLKQNYPNPFNPST
ncbi:MAG: hypothetical protein V3V16_06940, partial [Melioribacteraceae bacterium]